eukprot:120169_1
MSYYEPALRKYFAAFDGTKENFSEVENLFGALYHGEFTLVLTDGQTLSRTAAKEMHAGYLAKGSKITLIHLRHIGLDCIDVKFRIESDEDVQIVRLVYSIEDGKLARAQIVESFGSVLKAKCASAFRVYNVMHKYPTNM